jgi:hypothetical protein
LLGQVHFDYSIDFIASIAYPVAVQGELGGGVAQDFLEDELVPVLVV